MWQTDISISSIYALKDNITRYLIENNINYQYSIVGQRDVFSIAESNDDKRQVLRDIIRQIILVDMKYQYLHARIDNTSLDDIRYLLLAEMLFFDQNYENELLYQILPLQYEYSLDGIFDFKLKNIKENWNYLIELFQRVHNSVEDIITLTKYMHASSLDDKKRIYISNKGTKIYMFDIRSGNKVTRVQLFEDEILNALFTAVSTHTGIIYIDKDNRFQMPIDTLRNIMNIEIV